MSAETIPQTKVAEVFKAHRAAETQLHADEDRLQFQPDLSPLATELQERARTGDSDAAFTLAKLYQACAAALMAQQHAAELERFMDGMRVMDISDAEVTAIRGQFDALKRRCDKFAAGPVLAAMSATWMARARELGHPGARLQQKPPSSPFSSPERAEYERLNRLAGIAVLQTRNSWDLARYSEALNRHSPYAADAFLFAACQLNEACAADPGAWSLNRAGLWILDGDGASLINLRNLAPRRRLIVEGQAAELMRLWRAGEFEQILRGNPLVPVPRGG